MSAVAPTAEQTKDLLQKLSLENKNNNHDAAEAAKFSGVQYPTANGAQAPKVLIPSMERSLTPVLPEYIDHATPYLHNGYPAGTVFYGGYDGVMREWFGGYVNPEGVEMSHGVYGDVYHHGYGYPPYSAYPPSASPIPSLAHESQMYTSQQYQYHSAYVHPHTAASTLLSSNYPLSSKREGFQSVVAEQPPVPVAAPKLNSNGVANESANGNYGLEPPEQTLSLASNGSYVRGVLPGRHHSCGHGDPRFGGDGMRSPIPWYDGHMFVNPSSVSATTYPSPSIASYNSSSAPARNQNVRSVPQPMGFHTPRPFPGIGASTPGTINRMYPTSQMYGQFGNDFSVGASFGSHIYDPRTNSRWGYFPDNSYRSTSRGNGYNFSNENLDSLGELNRGPRANRFRNQKVIVPAVTISKEQNSYSNDNVEDPAVVPAIEQYNRTDFPEKYLDAKFFIIKSYSEDDIHKSIKYNIWASTPNGNKKLDAAYKEAQEKADRCPVFLFFSVNTSGQFLGVAEMVGPVDFNSTVDYWQQDKWNGCFNLKWHIVKDVPNTLFKHIILEYNENKPVTNSRDTQEVKLEQGLQMLKIFKEHYSKTSILDDFGFYETRQKAMFEKRAKQQQNIMLVADGKLADLLGEKVKDGSNENARLLHTSEPIKLLKKEVLSNPSSLNYSVPKVDCDTPKEEKPATEIA